MRDSNAGIESFPTSGKWDLAYESLLKAESNSTVISFHDDKALSTASAFLEQAYKEAYESRDLGRLGTVWHLDPQWRAFIAQLFAENRRIGVTLDIPARPSETSEEGKQFSIPFSQMITAIDLHGRFLTHGPFYCVADVQYLDTGGWVVAKLSDDPGHPQQCRPKEQRRSEK
jgi:hypothetical protein